MFTYLRPALVLIALLTLLTGVAYPLALTGFAQIVVPTAANGSQIQRGGTVVGSALIAQSFTSDRYFWPRPSAAGERGYDAEASSGSNLGPLSKKLINRIGNNVASLHEAGATMIPGDAVTASGSGLDPHISPAFAALQIVRVATARGMPPAEVRAQVDAFTETPSLGIFGEPRINVLSLNLALDAARQGGAG